MNYKMLLLPLLAGTLIVTGCAHRKPAANATTVGSNGAMAGQNGADATAYDPYADIDQRGGSALGVTDANRPFLAKRVIHFDYDSSDLSQEDYQTLRAHAQYLVANANSRIALVGHTDERGTREYNMALGERRAKAAETFLNTSGVNSNQTEPVSYGKEQPVAEGHNEDAWRQNRRVEIIYEAVPPLLSRPQR